jgi:regulator of protease activity HflC (stomatin/prohibitin superfamily)
MIYVTISLAVFLFIFWKTALVVPMREACVKERLGKFAGVLEPGLHILIPFFDRVAYRHEIREQVLDIPAQTCITRDNIQINVDGLVYLKVVDPQKASYGIEDYRRASVNLAQTTMRSEVGKLTLSQSFSERDKLNETIVQEIDKASDPWGIKVLRYELKNISPSPHVTHTLEQAMEAERQRRAEVTLATAEKEATIAASEGRRQEAINLSVGQRQARINIAKGRAQEITTLADASAESIRMVGEAIAQPGGNRALQMRIIEQFVSEYAEILNEADITVVPGELANIQGFFKGIGDVSDKMAGIVPQVPRA